MEAPAPGFFFSSSPVLLFSPRFFFLSPSHSLCFPFLLPSACASLCLCIVFVSYLAKLEKFTWKKDEDNGVLWTALFPFSLAFPLVNSFYSFAFPSYWYYFFFTVRLSLLPECWSFEGDSTVPLLCFRLPVLPSSSSRLPQFLYSPCSLSLPVSFSLQCFCPLVMVPPLAFIAQGKHCGGNGRRDSSHKTCPIIRAICCKTYPCFNAENDFLWRRQWMVETTPFQNFKMNIFDLVLGCFDNFVIKPPIWIVIESLDFSAFSGLVLGFGLFQLSP